MKIRLKLPHSQDLLLVIFLIMPVLKGLFISKIPGGSLLLSFGIVGLIAFSMIKKKNFFMKYIDVFIVYSIVAVLFIYQFATNPSVRIWIMRDYGVRHMFLIGGIFAYPIMRVQDNVGTVMRNMKISAVVLGLYYAYQVIEPITKGYWEYEQFGILRHSESNMSWSYGMLLLVCIMSILLIIEKKKYMIIPIAISLVGILLYGSRGTIISFIIGVVLILLFLENKKADVKKYVLIIIAAAAAMFILSDTGLTLIENVTDSLGIESRFIDSFLNTLKGGDSFDEESSGRDRIWKVVIGLIKENPFGVGVMGHRNAIYRIGIKWGYSHDVFLDLIVELGWIFGTLVILVGLYGIVKFFRKVKDVRERLLFIIFITVSCELLLSGYIWLHYGLWGLLGIYMNHFRAKWQNPKSLQAILNHFNIRISLDKN